MVRLSPRQLRLLVLLGITCILRFADTTVACNVTITAPRNILAAGMDNRVPLVVTVTGVPFDYIWSVEMKVQEGSKVTFSRVSISSEEFTDGTYVVWVVGNALSTEEEDSEVWAELWVKWPPPQGADPWQEDQKLKQSSPEKFTVIGVKRIVQEDPTPASGAETGPAYLHPGASLELTVERTPDPVDGDWPVAYGGDPVYPAWRVVSQPGSSLTAPEDGETNVEIDTTEFALGQYTVAANCGEYSEAEFTFYVTQVMVKKLTYSATNAGHMKAIQKDDNTGQYSTPHWVDNSTPLNGNADDAGDQNSPVCFDRKATMVVNTEFKIADGVTPGTVKVRGTGPTFGSSQLTFAPVTATVSAGVATVTDHECEAAFDDTVRFLNRLEIRWEVSLDDGTTWQHAGTTASQAYLVWAVPTITIQHTLVHTATVAADGIDGTTGTNDDRILDAIWLGLKTMSISRVSDGRILTYYGFRDENGNGVWDEGVDGYRNEPGPGGTQITQYDALIADGNGQCNSWATLMRALLRAHGRSSINGSTIERIAVNIKPVWDEFAIQTWYPHGAGPWTVIDWDAGVDGSNQQSPAVGEAADGAGEEGQGTSPNPPSTFENHYIVQVNGMIYDPSYGIRITSLDFKKYEDAAFAGSVSYDPYMVGTLESLPADDGNAANLDDEINTYQSVGW